MTPTLEGARVDTISGTEGSTGKYWLEPLEIEVPRVQGAGLDGIADAPEMDRKTHFRLVREGKLGSVHSWGLATAVDGPDTRLTMFLAGCPLRCVYCHDPDALQMRESTLALVDDLLDKILRYRAVYQAARGGVTSPGGEPMTQPMSLKRLLRGAKANEVHTSIDTSGSLGTNFSDRDLELLDMVMLDVKSDSPDTYRKIASHPLQPAIDLGRRLFGAGIPVWIRFVTAPGWTDDPDNVSRVANIVAPWKDVQRLEVLPFHQMARDKWEDLGTEYLLEGVEPPSKEAVEAVRAIFRSRGVTVLQRFISNFKDFSTPQAWKNLFEEGKATYALTMNGVRGNNIQRLMKPNVLHEPLDSTRLGGPLLAKTFHRCVCVCQGSQYLSKTQVKFVHPATIK